MAAESPTWPPALKAFVNLTFSQCNDTNREKVETELKKRIYDAYSSNTMWTIDWANVKLDALKAPAKRKKNAINLIPSAQLSAIASSAASGVAFASTSNSTFEEQNMRQKRQKRFENDRGFSPVVSGPVPNIGQTNGKGKSAMNSFRGLSIQEQRHLSSTPDPVFDPNVIDWDEATIVGTSQQLEKPYLRLTSAPDPREVRPLAVLKQTLDHLKRKWRAENNYAWVCDQFKSLRQDLTVQRIKNDFTVMAYEIHARIALEKGDLGEYNQCQSQLRELYKYGLQGHPMEFLAYRILYMVHTRNRSDFNALLASLTPEQLEEETVKHALAVRSSLATSNYHQFFKLFQSAPKMGPYMMDHFIDRERINALLVISKAYKTIPLAYLTDELAFDDSSLTHEFLLKYNAAHYIPESPAPPILAKPISISLSSPKPPKITAAERAAIKQREEEERKREKRQLDCKAAYPQLLAASQTFNKVDIKVQ